MQTMEFTEGSDIVSYFEMLPDTPLKRSYQEMQAETDPARKELLQRELRTHAVPGSIDVNIMTKLDRDNYRNGEKLPPEYCFIFDASRILHPGVEPIIEHLQASRRLREKGARA